MSVPSSTPTEPRPAVLAEELEKTFPGGVRALGGLSFSLRAGELVAIVGGNGSGKTTLLGALYGIVAPDRGRVRVLGLDPVREGPALRRRSGFASQEAALDVETTGWETLHLFYALRALPQAERRRRLAELVEDHGLAAFADRRIATWSGGQRRRLHLALATMHAPDLVLLDEPTTGLDPEARNALWHRMVAWRQQGGTVVVTTHDLDDVAARCDRVLVLDGGRLLADEHPTVLTAQHGRARIRVELAQAPVDVVSLKGELEGLPGVRDIVIEGPIVTFSRAHHPDGREPAFDLLGERGGGLRSYERQDSDLASAYFQLTGTPWRSPPPPTERRPGGRGA